MPQKRQEGGYAVKVIKNARLRKALRILIPFLLIPGTVAAGAWLFPGQHYLLTAFLVALFSLVLFISGFERRQTGARRLVIVAVMTALCIAGRFIPLFKPITALTVITAMYLGGESGFLVGALSALISNFSFGQGPWTPFQMLAWGLIGLLAGALKEPLKKNLWLLCTFGALCGIVYSMVMDVWTVLWYNRGFDVKLYLAAMSTALPHTVLYALSNFLFLYVFARPFGEKMTRIQLKYGI